MDILPSLKIAAFHACLAAAVPGVAWAQEPLTDGTTYSQWVARNALIGSTGRGDVDVKSVPLKLAVMALEGDDAPVRPDRFDSPEIRSGIEVTLEGEITGFRRTSMGEQGGGGTRLSPAELARLDEMLADLPNDLSHLPPPGRRLLLQAVVGGQPLLRVYDRAKAPASLWKLLRAIHSDLAACVPHFKPSSQIDARRYEAEGFLCLSPDGRQLLYTGLNQPLQFWEPVTHELLGEIRNLGSKSIAFSPDGSRAVIGGSLGFQVLDTANWKMIRKDSAAALFSQFSPDGRYLTLQGYRGGLHLYDAGTWKPVKEIPEVPPDAVQYFPAAKNQMAVIRSVSGAVSLWDSANHREIGRIDDHAEVYQAVYSPDERLVAVATRNTANDKSPSVIDIGIWQTDSGKKIHTLRPFELSADANDGLKALLWSPDGNYVLAGTTVYTHLGLTTGISIFNVATGRHCGQFDALQRIIGAVILPGGSQLVEGSGQGKIQFWDFPSALEKIHAFESSLPALDEAE